MGRSVDDIPGRTCFAGGRCKSYRLRFILHIGQRHHGARKAIRIPDVAVEFHAGLALMQSQYALRQAFWGCIDIDLSAGRG